MTINEIIDDVQVENESGGEYVRIERKKWEAILAFLDNARWEESFAKTPHILERLADEALEEFRNGETTPLIAEKL